MVGACRPRVGVGLDVCPAFQLGVGSLVSLLVRGWVIRPPSGEVSGCWSPSRLRGRGARLPSRYGPPVSTCPAHLRAGCTGWGPRLGGGGLAHQARATGWAGWASWGRWSSQDRWSSRDEWLSWDKFPSRDGWSPGPDGRLRDRWLFGFSSGADGCPGTKPPPRMPVVSLDTHAFIPPRRKTRPGTPIRPGMTIHPGTPIRAGMVIRGHHCTSHPLYDTFTAHRIHCVTHSRHTADRSSNNQAETAKTL